MGEDRDYLVCNVLRGTISLKGCDISVHFLT